MPSGKFLMEDFHFAGGLPALMQRLRDLLDLSAMTVTGRPLGGVCSPRRLKPARVR